MHLLIAQSTSIVHECQTVNVFYLCFINPELFGTNIWVIGIVWKQENDIAHLNTPQTEVHTLLLCITSDGSQVTSIECGTHAIERYHTLTHAFSQATFSS